MSVLSLVDRVRRVCDRWGVSVDLVAGDGLGDHAAGGWFDEERKIVEVVVDRPGWAHVLAHEFGHVQQWAEGAFVDAATKDGYAKHEPWLAREVEGTPADVLRWFRAIQQCERDAERRAISILVEEAVLTDKPSIEAYARAANTYVLAYEAARRMRKWPRRSSLRAELVAKMPSALVDDLGALPPGTSRLYAQCAKASA